MTYETKETALSASRAPALSVKLYQKQNSFTLDIDVDLPAGLNVFFGASGSGKTSVINAVAGLSSTAQTPIQGRVTLGNTVLMDTLNGIFLPPHKRQLGYIFQDARLFHHMSVARNLDYARRVSRRDFDRVEYDRVVEMLGIGPLLQRRPNHLSGGEKQRVAIGRALLAKPELILADEPLAALDGARKNEILPYFERLRDESALPIVYVTHDPAEVARLATTVVALEQGKVVRQGTAAEVLGDPSFTPGHIRNMGAVIEAVVTAHHSDGLSELNAGGVSFFLPRQSDALGSRLRLRILAQDVMLAKHAPEGLSALNILPATIQELRMDEGPAVIVSLDTPAGRVLARITKRSAIAMDLKVSDRIFGVIKSVAVAPEETALNAARHPCS